MDHAKRPRSLAHIGGLAIIGLLTLSSLSAPAEARSDEHGNGKSHGKGDHENKGGKSEHERGQSPAAIQLERGAPFIDIERQTVVSYYGKLPPGQAKKGRIPPGFQAKRGAYLPAGYGDPLPEVLVVRLPPRPGYERVVVGSDVVLMETATRMIVDVLTGGIR